MFLFPILAFVCQQRINDLIKNSFKTLPWVLVLLLIIFITGATSKSNNEFNQM